MLLLQQTFLPLVPITVNHRKQTYRDGSAPPTPHPCQNKKKPLAQKKYPEWCRWAFPRGQNPVIPESADDDGADDADDDDYDEDD